MAAQRTVFVNSDGDEQQFDTLGSDTAHRNDASRVVVVNSDGDEQNLVTAGSTSPIPGAFQQVVLVNSAGVEQEIGAVGTADPIPSRYVQAVIVDEDGAEMLVETLGGVTPIPAKFRQLLAVNSDGDGQTFTIGTPISLTLSGNEITDAVRATATSGDGLDPEGSMGVWEATTNLVTNGGLETNDTGWTDVSATGSRVTSQAKFGSASLEVVTGNAAANEGCYHNFTATAAAYTVSAWVRGAGGGTVRMAVRDNAGGSPQTGSAVTLTSSWQRISLTTTALSAATWRCYVETDSQQNITFQVDGVQAELQPLATPYVETDGGTAARAAALVQAPAAVLDETQGWVAVRLRVPYATSGGPGYGARFMSWATGTNRISVYWQGGSGTVVRRGTGADAFDIVTRTWAAGDVITLIGKWDATKLYQSFNGAAFNAGTASAVIPTITDTVKIGGQVSPGVEADVDFFWFACGLGTLSNADAATIHAWGNSDPPPGLFPTAADLTLIWRAIDSTARTY